MTRTAYCSLITAHCLLITACCLLAFSCAPKQTLTGTDREVRDSVIITEKLVPIEIPAATVVSPEINYSVLDSMIRAGVNVGLINSMLRSKQDPQSKLSARIQVDEDGNLRAVCELQEQLIQVLTREIDRLRLEVTTHTVTVSKTWYQELWDDFKQLIVGAALLLAVLTVRKFIP